MTCATVAAVVSAFREAGSCSVTAPAGIFLLSRNRWMKPLRSWSGRHAAEKALTFPGQRSVCFRRSPGSPLYRSLSGYLHRLSPQIRRSAFNAASGGIISAILIWLLEKKMIDGAVVLGMSEYGALAYHAFYCHNKGRYPEGCAKQIHHQLQ